MPKPSEELPASSDLATAPCTGGLKRAVPVPMRSAAPSMAPKAMACGMGPLIEARTPSTT